MSKYNAYVAPPEEDATATFKDRWGVEHTYRVGQYFGAMKMLEQSGKVTNMMAEAMGMTADAVSLHSPDLQAVGIAVQTLMRRIDENGGGDWVVSLMEHVTRSRPAKEGEEESAINGEVWEKVDVHFDRIYAGNMGELIRAFSWVIKVQFNPFGSGALDGLAPQLEALSTELLGALTRAVQTRSGGDSPTTGESASESSSTTGA